MADEKYLSFVLGEQLYGIEILKVQEIICMAKITPIPQTADFVKGVINLRGKVIAVIDLRCKLGMQEKEYTRETCIIIVEIKDKPMGVIVDAVNEVAEIISSQDAASSLGVQVRADFIKSIARTDESLIVLLDINCILTCEEMVALEDSAVM